MSRPGIDRDRLWADIEALARITEPDRPWTRRSFTAKFAEGRGWLQQRFREAGLEVSLDAGGNLIGRRPGRDAALAPLVSGSHSDTVPAGGRFDGILGVVCALEAARALQEAGHRLRHSFEVVDFLAEEPSVFGLSCIGSRAWAGALDSGMLARTAGGTSLAEAIGDVGGNPDQIARAARGPDSVAGYIEVHIEQGPVLETAGLPIGIVSGIAGIRRDALTFTGRADHSGTTPMNARADALAAAAAVITDLRCRALDEGAAGGQIVATVGHIEVSPNAANAVPGRVDATLEVRSPDAALIDRFCDRAIAAAKDTGKKLGVGVESRMLSSVLPTACDEAVQAAIGRAAERAGHGSTVLPSGAGHDAVFVSATGPVGMIFVPCRGGRSHTPEEWAEPDACAAGAETLLGALLELDGAAG